MRIYLETSVLGFLFATDVPEKMEITQRFFKKLKDHEPFISELVLEEIEKTKEPKRELLKGVIRAYNLKALRRTKGAENLANKYVEKGIIPKKVFSDALHIALTTVYKLDALISWNLSHIVRLRTIALVKEVNKNLGYKDIIICTPEEVIGYERT